MNKKMKISDYKTPAEKVLKKIQNNMKLYPEDMLVIQNVLADPLSEFCAQEALFRLEKFHNFANQDLDTYTDLIERSKNIIKDNINYCEYLYDNIDSDLHDAIYDEVYEFKHYCTISNFNNKDEGIPAPLNAYRKYYQTDAECAVKELSEYNNKIVKVCDKQNKCIVKYITSRRTYIFFKIKPSQIGDKIEIQPYAYYRNHYKLKNKTEIHNAK